nr:DMT family transporter [Phycisphaerales bacterium]
FWLPLLLVVIWRKEMPAGLVRASVVPVAFNIAGQTAFAWGPVLLEPGFFSFVFRVQIVFVAIGAWMLFPAERVVLRSGAFWLGVGLVLAGSAGLFAFRDASAGAKGLTPVSGQFGMDVQGALGSADAVFWLGVGVSLLSGVLFAGYGLSVRYYVGKFAPVTAFGVICQFTAIGMIGLTLAFGVNHGERPLDMTGVQWIKLIASAFIGIAISHVMYYASLRRLGVSTSVGIIQLQPIITALGSTLIFDERLTAAQWASGLVGVGGAMVMLWAGARAQAEAKAKDAQAAAGEGGGAS